MIRKLCKMTENAHSCVQQCHKVTYLTSLQVLLLTRGPSTQIQFKYENYCRKQEHKAAQNNILDLFSLFLVKVAFI